MCRSRNDPYAVLLLLLTSFAPAGAPFVRAQSAADTPAPADGVVLLLDVRVNGFPLQLVGEFLDENGRLSISEKQYAGLGFHIDPALVAINAAGEARVYLDRVPGLTYRIDMRAQVIDITVPIAALATTELVAGSRTARVETQSAWGAALGFDLFGEWATNDNSELFRTNLSLNLDARVFSPWFALTSTGFMTYGDSGSDFVRLDTTLMIDDLDTPWRIRVGDSYNGGAAWTRPFRFGGIQWASNFELRPDIVTMPIPQLDTDAAVPSALDLYINGAHRYSQAVTPGPVRISDLPVVSGTNNVRLVVTDRTGRRTEISLPFYVSSNLLARGLSEFSFDAGFVRERYSVASNDYGPAFGSGYYAWGASDTLTLRGYAAASKGYFGGGVGAGVSVANLFVVDGNVVWSTAPGLRGFGWLVSVEHSTPTINLYARYVSGGNYTDLANLFGSARVIEQFIGNFGINVGNFGQFNLAYTRQRLDRNAKVDLASGTYGVDLFRHRLHLSATGFRDMHSGDWGAYLSLSMPLGRNAEAYLQKSWRNGKSENGVQLSGRAFDDRLAWQVEGHTGAFSGVAAQADWQGPRFEGRMRVEHVGSDTSVQAQISEALVFMDDRLFLSSWIDDAFTVVEVEDSPGVRVSLENQVVGRTGRGGRLLVNGLQSYVANAISVDPLDLPVDAEIRDTSSLVAPRALGGTITRFAVSRERSAVLVVELPGGELPPVGAVVALAGVSEPAMVGYGGEIYLRGLAVGENRVEISWAEGNCAASFDMPSLEGGLPRIGPVPCVR